jgi:hypothetical protein
MIEIDPNIRVNGNHTFVYVDDPEELGMLKVGYSYVLYQPEMSMAWPGTIVEVKADGYVEFEVAWEKWKNVTQTEPPVIES